MQNIRFLESTIQMPLMALPVRSSLVKVNDREILISPGSKIPKEQYDPKWNVTDIVAPNLFHHGGVPKAASIYKSANLWASPGLQEKRPDIPWTYFLDENKWPYSEDLQLIQIQGMPKVNEFVFFHKASRSLIATDFCFNMIGLTSWGPRIILGLFGTYNQFGISKFFLRLRRDKNAFNLSLQKIMALDFENIIVSHGQNIIGSAQEKLFAALKQRGLDKGLF